MNEQKITDYTDLIKAIKDSPVGQEWDILSQYPDLIDQNLIKTIKQAIYVLANRGDKEEADRFVKLVIQVKDKLSEADPQVQLKKLRKQCRELNEQTINLYQQGAFTEGIAVAEQALELARFLWGTNHQNVATSYNNLALLYESQGHYSEAEPLYKEAVAIDRQALPPNHPKLATHLNNLALLYESQGRYSEAEPLYKEAVAIDRQALPPNHPDLATHLNNLAGLYSSQGRYSEAEPLYLEALAIHRQTLPPNHPDLAPSYNNLANLYRSQGRYREAEPLFLEAVAIGRQALPTNHPDIAAYLNNLATLYRSQVRYSEAEPLYQEAFAINRQALPPNHPHVAFTLTNLALLLVTTERFGGAFLLMQEALRIEDYNIRQRFGSGSERDRLNYLKTIRHNFEKFLSLVWQYFPQQPQAVQAAFNLVLRRKCLTASAQAAQNLALASGRYPHLLPQVQELRKITDKIISLTISLASQFEHRDDILEQIGTLQKQADQINRLIAREIPEVQLQNALPDLQAVALELPLGSTLLEFVHFDVLDFTAPKQERWKPARYLAFILPAQQPDQVAMVDLGDAAEIDRLIRLFRAGVSFPPDHSSPPQENAISRLDFGDEEEVVVRSSSTFVSHGQGLRRLLLDRVFQVLDDLSPDPSPARRGEFDLSPNPSPARRGEKDVTPIPSQGRGAGGVRSLIIAPDSNLNLLPFQLLAQENGRLLIEDYSISYLSVGREILRKTIVSHAIPSAPLIMADPNFDYPQPFPEVEDNIVENMSQNCNIELNTNEPQTLLQTLSGCQRVLGTRFLGETVAKLLKVEPYLENEARESYLHRHKSPKILLFATHGLFVGQKQEQNYHHLIQDLLTCPEGEKINLLKNYRDLWNKDLLALMRLIADLYKENNRQNLADFLNYLATIIENEVKPSSENLFSNVEDPMLRSVLALTGTNTVLRGQPLSEEYGKGLVFALDVAALDLWATEISILSACQTGLGDLASGEGVFGLRRAFAIAGSKTLLMSLWSVPDKATALLMQLFFDKIDTGWGRLQALEFAQDYIKNATISKLQTTELGQTVLKELYPKNDYPEPDYQPLNHPYFWGAWVCQGETAPLSSPLMN
ncbi:CHAT domain-containing tetratricopeptide repeat protein [Planktothrix agardhii]|uniref:CHAT domain-containing tetratricopeptide repeat protein n=1 Tax=Planktothrix agardhii TaxID=1160 RepID=UPI0004226FFE|nr:CHAT domain-containing tetratricopeptide repeat protein [Planktothrix agardhii]